MYKIIRLLVITFLLAISRNAFAVIIDGKEWMQVNDFVGYSYNDFDAIFNSSTGECDVVNCFLGGKLDVSGYTWASTEDVSNLLKSYTGSPLTHWKYDNTTYFGTNALSQFFSDFIPTNYSMDLSTLQIRVLTSSTSASHIAWNDYLTITGYFGSQSSLSHFAALEVHSDRSGRYNDMGGFLYKAAVIPTPNSLWLITLGILCMCLNRYQQNFVFSEHSDQKSINYLWGKQPNKRGSRVGWARFFVPTRRTHGPMN